MTSKLTYDTLDKTTDEIRLLRILPDTDPTLTVRCQIFNTSLNGQVDHEPYQALSYVWGDPRNQHLIEVDNIQINVGSSLETALRAIRKDSEQVMIWADAICINQNDVEERNHQVGMMGLVYSKAQGVISWLGEASDESDLAIDSIVEWAPFLHTASNSLSGPMNRRVVDLAVQTVPSAFDPQARHAIRKLSMRPYWTRVWIVQEIMLAKHVEAMCGLKCVDMRLVKDAMGSLTAVESMRVMGECSPELFDPEAINFITSPMFYMVLRMSGEGPYMPAFSGVLSAEAVADVASLDATDPRDKVFGLLGLVSPTSDYYEMIRPDYKKTLGQVYSNYSQYPIMTSSKLEILRMAGRIIQSGNGQDSLASWVVDWRDKSVNMGMSLYEEEPEVPINFSDLIRWSANDQILNVKGFEIDVIEKAYDGALFPIWRRTEEYGGGSDFQSFAENFLRPLSSATGESMLSQYFRLVGIDRRKGEDKRIQINQEAYFESAALFLKYIFVQMQAQQVFPPDSMPARMLHAMPFALTIAFLGIDAPLEQREKLVDMIFQTDLDKEGWYEPAIRLRTDKYIPFVTQSGKMGLGSYNIQETDHICQLATHMLPFALSAKDDSFVNHGECFVLDLELLDLLPEVVPHMKEFGIY